MRGQVIEAGAIRLARIRIVGIVALRVRPGVAAVSTASPLLQSPRLSAWATSQEFGPQGPRQGVLSTLMRLV